MPKFYRLTIFSLFALIATVAPVVAGHFDADSTAADSSATVWDRRFRLIVGGGVTTGRSVESARLFPIVNGNYRWSSNVNRKGSATTLGAGVEVGMNYLFPYVKVGPELRIGRGFIAAHCGMTMAFFVGAHDAGMEVIPFLGAAGGYCFTLEGLGLEVESGVNQGSYGDEGVAIPYVALALAFR